MMARRKFLTLLSSAAVAPLLPAIAEAAADNSYTFDIDLGASASRSAIYVWSGDGKVFFWVLQNGEVIDQGVARQTWSHA